MIVLKEFEFDAAHYLPSYNGKCEHLHGHTYKLVVKVDGRPDMEGMVLDFSLLKKIVQTKVLRKLDHNKSQRGEYCHMGVEPAGKAAVCGKSAAV